MGIPSCWTLALGQTATIWMDTGAKLDVTVTAVTTPRARSRSSYQEVDRVVTFAESRPRVLRLNLYPSIREYTVDWVLN